MFVGLNNALWSYTRWFPKMRQFFRGRNWAGSHHHLRVLDHAALLSNKTIKPLICNRFWSPGGQSWVRVATAVIAPAAKMCVDRVFLTFFFRIFPILRCLRRAGRDPTAVPGACADVVPSAHGADQIATRKSHGWSHMRRVRGSPIVPVIRSRSAAAPVARPCVLGGDVGDVVRGSCASLDRPVLRR
jgi:hypothetical protein